MELVRVGKMRFSLFPFSSFFFPVSATWVLRLEMYAWVGVHKRLCIDVLGSNYTPWFRCMFEIWRWTVVQSWNFASYDRCNALTLSFLLSALPSPSRSRSLFFSTFFFLIFYFYFYSIILFLVLILIS